MKKMSLTIALIAASFLLGFAFESIMSNKKNTPMKKVTGIGGIFFKCRDPKATNEWYKTHLGFDTTPYGTSFEWLQVDDHTKKGLTQWNPFADNTKYFEPSTKDFMVNYRVENLEALVEELKKENVTIVDKMNPMTTENLFIFSTWKAIKFNCGNLKTSDKIFTDFI